MTMPDDPNASYWMDGEWHHPTPLDYSHDWGLTASVGLIVAAAAAGAILLRAKLGKG